MKKIKSDSRDALLLNLRKAHTHLSSVVSMLERGDRCLDIMQQNLAVIGLLKSAHRMIMENHLDGYFSETLALKNSAKRKVLAEVLKVTNLVNI